MNVLSTSTPFAPFSFLDFIFLIAQLQLSPLPSKHFPLQERLKKHNFSKPKTLTKHCALLNLSGNGFFFFFTKYREYIRTSYTSTEKGSLL